jgi:5-methylcytosine-specific restriction endonuclease McrA
VIPAKKPVTDDPANYSHIASIRNTKGEQRPVQLGPQVLATYPQYNSRLNDPTGPIPHGWDTPDHEVLKENYDYLARARFSELRGEVLRAAGGLCPYCHQLSANEIDHFLPRARFGEYAILSDNLVPICSDCNKKKSRRYLAQGRPGRRYVHPYFDHLPSRQFLHAEVVATTTVSLMFSIVPSGEMAQETAARLQTQFVDLGLADRYRVEAAGEMSSRLGSLYVYFRHGGHAEVSKYLQIDHQSAAHSFGANHWRPVALGALASSAWFCDGGFTALGPDPELWRLAGL